MVLKIIANLNGGDLVTPDNELTYKIYGSSDNYASPIATLGSALNDAKVSVTAGVVTIDNVDVGTEDEFKISSVDEAGNESILSDSASGFNFDSDYQAVLNFATSEGDTLPSASQQILQNNVVMGFKDKGLWDKEDAFGLFATDASFNFALICWKRLIKMTAFNSPSFTTNGGIDGGGTAYIDTKFKSATDGVNFLLDDAGYSVNVGTTTPSGDVILGNTQPNEGGVRLRQKPIADSELNSSSFPTSIDYQNGGNLHIDRISSTQVVLKSENDIKTVSSNSTTLTSNPALIFRLKENYGNGNIKAFSARSSFTDQEKNDYNTIIDTYLNAI